jgi:hypothetical protein
MVPIRSNLEPSRQPSGEICNARNRVCCDSFRVLDCLAPGAVQKVSTVLIAFDGGSR